MPADAGFCLIVQQLRDQAERWQRSPWIKSLRVSPLGKALENTPEMQRLTRLDGELQKHFNLGWANLRDDILGDAVVLAYWPAPPGQPDQEQGMLLVRARSAKLLKQFVDSVNDEQQKSKELKELDRQGVSRRQVPAPGRSEVRAFSAHRWQRLCFHRQGKSDAQAD